MHTLSLADAAADIRRTCDRHERPFFFMVGAGISCPAIPQASDIVEHCKKEAEGAQAPAGHSAMESYAWWVEKAYASPADRQEYLERLIEGKSITHANLRLAHLLLDRKVANLAVTTNFDDFLSQALTLFGARYVLCDHPRTALRVEPERDELQIVHVHGSYRFYDCCNLAGEIEERANWSADEPSSMRDFLERLLSTRSPIVVGYSGWENDVFMSALRRRMKEGLKFNLYWICYKSANLAELPEFLKSHRDVRFVVPSESPKAVESGKGESQREPVLPATDVFDELIRRFKLETPLLIRDPLGYLAKHLRDSLPREDAEIAGRDLYFIGKVIETVERAKMELTRAALEPVRDALRRSQYREAVGKGRKIALEDLDAGQLREMVEAMTGAARGLFDNSPEELAAYDLAVKAGDKLTDLGASDAEVNAKVAWALLYKGVTFGQLNRSEEAVAVYEEVVRRYGEATEPALRELVAKALVYKGYRLGQLNRSEEEVAVYQDVVRRYGESAEPVLCEQVATALFNKGVTLGQLNRSEEEVAVYDEVVRRNGEAAEPALREWVAKALFNKGVRLGQLNRSEEAVAVYEEVVRRYGESAEPALREQAAMALVNQGATLGQLNRSEEAVAVYEEVVRRYGEAAEPALREQVAMALVNRGHLLGQLSRSEEGVAVYEEVVRQYGEAAEPVLREQVASALNGIGFRELLRAKGHRKAGEEQQAVAALTRSRQRLKEALERNPDHAFILGNMGYAEFLSGDAKAASEHLVRAIALGGEKIRRGELADAEINPLPEDEAFKDLVRSIPPATGG